MNLSTLLQRIANRGGYKVRRISDNRVEFDYPVSESPRYGYGKPRHAAIEEMIARNRDRYAEVLSGIEGRAELLDEIPLERAAKGPFWNNTWLPPLDAAVLMHFLLQRRPRKYLEIGSGNSTMFARHAVSSGNLETKITSIDPQPRAEIDALCDEVIRYPLETVDLGKFDTLEAGDILFFDGSHRVFTDSDVTVFFLEVLPRIRAGVLIHIHDIFWPDDYPPEWGRRYYSEQFMLGALMLAGKVETVFPSHYVSTDATLGARATQILRGSPFLRNYWGTSFWMNKAG